MQTFFQHFVAIGNLLVWVKNEYSKNETEGVHGTRLNIIECECLSILTSVDKAKSRTHIQKKKTNKQQNGEQASQIFGTDNL